nr:phenylalanine--tRNA ligase subunit beta [Parachlamydiaceae bacterium]
MKFSLSWLKEFIPTQIPANEIANILTSAGLEVDGIEDITLNNQALSNVLFNDSIFEVSLTPNLGHCSSMLGIARELAAAKLGSVNLPKIFINESSDATTSLIKVNVADAERCPRYACRIVQNVIIEPSPEWMQQRLTSAGIRPINNIVDITNYVALEVGQPLHAFDYDCLQGKELIIRTAFEGESINTLDNQLRQLTTEDLLICDNGQLPNQSRPIALAGIMGGQETEVSDSTVNVLIESANFNPRAIRRTSRRLGLSTDASKRFERNVDPNGVLWALDRAAMLMEQIAKGKVLKAADLKKSDFPKLTVTCRSSRVNQLLGTLIGSGEMEDIFERLEFIHQWDGKDLFELQIPTYRADITGEIDIIEEIARIYGYDNITPVEPKYHGSELPHAAMYLFEKKARSHMLSRRLQEFLTCDLIGPTLLNVIKVNSMPADATIQVLNPTSIEQSILRTSLLPGLLQLVKYNHDHQNSHLAGFEIGRIHFKSNGNYKEQSMLGIVMAGDADLAHWSRKSSKLDFFDLKGIIES